MEPKGSLHPVPKRICFLPLLAVMILFTLGSLQAQHIIGSAVFGSKRECEVEVVSVFDKGRTTGFMPVLLRMRNGLGRDVSWHFKFEAQSGNNDGNFSSNFDFKVRASSELEQHILVPIQTNFRLSSDTMDLAVEVSSPGFDRENLWWSTRSSGNVGVTASITGGDQDIQGRYEPPTLPADWRAYVGLASLVMTDEEWKSLDASVKAGIQSWLRLEGTLHIYTQSPSQDLESLGLIDHQNEVTLFDWDGVTPALASVRSSGLDPQIGVVHRTWTAPGVPGRSITWEDSSSGISQSEARREYMNVTDRSELVGPSRGLKIKLGDKAFGAWAVMLILLVFGIVIGPVNLFLFAPPGRRQRLFVTVPLISVITSLFLTGAILLRDGVGGDGARIMVMRLDPDAREMAISQEQFTRTGVMLSQDLEFDDPTYLSHAALERSAWSRVQRDEGNQLTSTYVPGEKERYLGDWFFSRSEQGHYLQQIRPTRARLEETNEGSEKQILSSLGFTLHHFFYCDTDGQWWTHEGAIETGQRVNLKSCEKQDYSKWIQNQENLSRKMVIAFPFTLSPGTFCAESADPKAGFIETRSDIEWIWQRAIVRGPMVTATNAN